MKRKKLTKAQQQFIDMMKAGYRLTRDTDGFYLGERQLSKRTILSLLKKRAIKPAHDGAFGRSQTYLVAE